MSSNAMQVYDSSAPITLWKEPEEVLAEARKAATALMSVMNQKQHKVVFNGETYLEREDWGTVARFYGCTAKVTETHYVEFGDVRGFEATAVCLDRDLREIGRAESMCLSEEKSWGEVAEYEWQDVLDEKGKKIWDQTLRNGKGGYKARKVEVGKVSKPLFQLRSMAQTRAEAKVLKSIFGWIVVLAGYRPSVAEEMTGDEQSRDDSDYVDQSETKSQTEKKTPPAEDSISGVIEEAKPGKEGAVWVVIDKRLIVIEKKFYQETMVVGSTLSAKVQKRSSKKVGEFYAVLAVSEVKPPTEGEVIDAEVVDDGAPPSDDQKPIEGLQSLFDSGVVTTGNNIPEKKAIGTKSAQSIYIIARKHEKETGFTEPMIKAVLAKLPKPLEHLSDLDPGMYATFERYARGEDATWKELLED